VQQHLQLFSTFAKLSVDRQLIILNIFMIGARQACRQGKLKNVSMIHVLSSYGSAHLNPKTTDVLF